MNGITCIIRKIAVLSVLLAASENLFACPFCSVESQTLSEETGSADAVVLAKLVQEAPPTDTLSFASDDPESGMATFEIVEAILGKELVAGTKEIKVVYFGEPDRDQVFLVSGIGSEKIDWTTPLPLSPAGVDYVRKLSSVPASGPERLEFFQEYFEHADPLLAQDAYDEFARAPYADVQALGSRMPHDQLVKWIADPQISSSRRRLYLTMLGVCGTADDVPMLEELIASDFRTIEPHLQRLVQNAMAMGAPLAAPAWIDMVDQDERRKKLGLDAMIACYLTLRGPEGLELIERRFLKNLNTEFTYVYSTIMALRFHGEEPSSNIPRERLLSSVRLLLDNPDYADQVIPDLARWEDWSVLDRLVKMFKESDKDGHVRQPVVTYLTVAAEQPGDVGRRAQSALGELEQLDPEGVKLAQRLAAFGVLGRARATDATAGAARPEAAEADDASATTAEDTRAFAASTAEIQEAEQSDPADFPDPAGFESEEQPAEAVNDDAIAESISTPAPAQLTVHKPPAAQASLSPATASDVAQTELNELFVIGVPLAAGLLLMFLYWLILRAGAV
jgi:hypothetical protein